MNTQRARSPAPPLPPSKDHSSSSHSTFSSNRPDSRYVNLDLAEAVRDSVHIGSEPRALLAPALPTIRPTNNISSNSSSRSIPRRTPSPLPPGASEGYQATHGYSQSSSDMSMMPQPQLPSQRMAVQNPFELDEVEPTGTGRIKPPGVNAHSGIESSAMHHPGRAKINRAMTG